MTFLRFSAITLACLAGGMLLGALLGNAAKADDVITSPGAVRPPVVERVSYFDTATCSDYLSVSRTDRINRNRELFRQALSNPGYIQVQLECAQNPTMLRRMELSIEKICRGREDHLVRNAWTSALNAHKYTCNWR